MKWLDLTRFDPKRDRPTVIGRVILLDDGTFSFEGEVPADIRKGVRKTSTSPDILRPENGEAYFVALQNTLQNPQTFLAGTIQEGSPPSALF